MLACQLAAFRSLVFPRTTAIAQSLFRWLTRRGWVVGSSQTVECTPEMPADFFKAMSNLQARVGLKQLGRLDRMVEHRRKMRRLYDKLLADAGWAIAADSEDADPVLVRYPVRVRNKQELLAAAVRTRIELGSWFDTPLHQNEAPLEAYQYSSGMCPEAEKACAQVVNLPLHPRVSTATARRTVEFLTNTGLPVTTEQPPMRPIG